MAAADVLNTADAEALLAAIDAGDDSCLSILADLLEEAGDVRADGLRRLKYHRPAAVTVRKGVTCFGWQRSWGHAHGIGTDAPALVRHADVFAWGDWLLCDHRSTAYLALAAALTTDVA